MKITMMGSGGVGGFFGGHLARIGCDVTFIARGKHLEAMRKSGLTIENKTLGDVHVPSVKVTDDPASLGVADVVILSVKLWDTEDAARAIRPIVGPHTGVLSLQNGVVKDDILRRVFDPSQVMIVSDTLEGLHPHVLRRATRVFIGPAPALGQHIVERPGHVQRP